CGRCLRGYIAEMNLVQEGRETVAHLCHLERREWRGRANILEKDKPGAVVMGKVRDSKKGRFAARQLITGWMRMMVTGRESLILGGIKSLAEILGFLEGTIKPFVEATDVGFLEGMIRRTMEAMDVGFLEGTIKRTMEAMHVGFLEGTIKRVMEVKDMGFPEAMIRALVEATDPDLLKGTIKAFGEVANQ
ncbi:unnamed protein product, partial [Effrenium voratum]